MKSSLSKENALGFFFAAVIFEPIKAAKDLTDTEPLEKVAAVSVPLELVAAVSVLKTISLLTS